MENYVIYNWNGQIITLTDVEHHAEPQDANTCMLYLNANFF